MEKLENRDTTQIDGDLYKEVMGAIESEYNLESIIDINKKSSTKIVFKDRKTAIRKVAEAIKRFSERNNLDIDVVKEHLLNTIEEKMQIDEKFKEEYTEAKKILSSDEEIEER